MSLVRQFSRAFAKILASSPLTKRDRRMPSHLYVGIESNLSARALMKHYWCVFLNDVGVADRDNWYLLVRERQRARFLERLFILLYLVTFNLWFGRSDGSAWRRILCAVHGHKSIALTLRSTQTHAINDMRTDRTHESSSIQVHASSWFVRPINYSPTQFGRECISELLLYGWHPFQRQEEEGFICAGAIECALRHFFAIRKGHTKRAKQLLPDSMRW